MLNFIFGRDKRFFDLLEQGAAAARESAGILVKLHAAIGHGPTETILGDLAQARRKHKRNVQEISQELTQVFATPLEREDIEALSTSLYKIGKIVEKVGERLVICPPGTRLSTVQKELANIQHACEVVQTLVGSLRHGANLEKIRDSYDRVQSLEGDADKLLLEHLRELYQSDQQDARLLIYWKDLYDLLERTTDRCRDVGNVVFHIVLKNS